jgi:hypothetical protein
MKTSNLIHAIRLYFDDYNGILYFKKYNEF